MIRILFYRVMQATLSSTLKLPMLSQDIIHHAQFQIRPF